MFKLILREALQSFFFFSRFYCLLGFATFLEKPATDCVKLEDMSLLHILIHIQIAVACSRNLLWNIFLQGYDLTKQKSPGYSHALSRFCRSSMFMFYSVNKQVPPLPCSASHGIVHRNSVSENFFKSAPLTVPSFSGSKGFYSFKFRPLRLERLQTNVAYDVAGAVQVINDLGLDTLTFLAVTVLIVPTFKSIKASPVRIF